MKKSLITGISALLLSVLTLGACGPVIDSSNNPGSENTDNNTSETQELFTIEQLLSGEISDETGAWEPTYNGQHVRIEKAGVVLAYEHEMYVQQTSGETVGDLHTIQVVNKDVDFTEYFYNNLVNVEGDITLLEDRIVIDNAQIELLSDGSKEDENYVFYWPNLDRAALDNATKFLSGTMVSSVLQVATKPETIVPGKEMSFKVAFPGEDLNTENPDNIFLMDYTIPATLNEEEVEEANKLFGSLNVKDGLSVLAAIHFVKGYFNYLYIPGVSTNDIYNYQTDLENVFSSAEEVMNDFIKFHTTTWEEWPSLAVNNDKGESLIYSFVGNDDKYTQANKNVYTITAYTYDVETVYNELAKIFQEKGWTIKIDQTEDFGVMELASPTGKNIVDLMQNEGSLTIGSVTETRYDHPETQTFETFEELKAGLKANVQRYAKVKDFLLPQGARNFNSNLVDAASVLKEGETVLSYFLSKKKESVNVVNKIEGAHELVRFNLSVTDQTRLNAIKDAYIAALEEAGFVKITVPTTTNKAPKGAGWYNVKSGEFIAEKSIVVRVVDEVAATETEPAVAAHGEFEFYVDCVSLEVNKLLRKLLPEEPKAE